MSRPYGPDRDADTSDARLADLPDAFVRHNALDMDWLRRLPDLVSSLASRWSISLDAPFAGIEINFVAPGTRSDGSRCVLKLSRHVRETQTEIAALRLWAGVGAARLLDAEPEVGAMLIERLEPGVMLAELAEADDDDATRIAAGVLRQLWRPAPDTNNHGLRPLESWCAAYERNRQALSGGAAGFPVGLFERADAVRRDLLRSTSARTVLHGDLHHFNVLRAQRAAWLAIDPKGLVGDCAFDVCQFFRNPRDMPRPVNSRRLDIFCAELSLDRQRVKDWCLVHAVLDACWNYEDGNNWRRSVARAEETLSF